MTRTPVVSALVVTWNNEGTLARCLDALRRGLPPGSEILVLDNRSVDESARIARRHGATVQANGSNVGFAAGMNRLAAEARGDVLLIVNPDLFVRPGAAGALLEHLAGGRERAIVGGLLLDPDEQLQIASARPFPTAAGLVRWLLTNRKPMWRVPGEAQSVDAVSGAFFATTRALWHELGGFDEGYRHSGEDLDLFWRAAHAGAEVWFEPAARATHLGGASVRQAPMRIDAIRLAGTLRFVRKREGPLAAGVLRAVLLSRSLVALALDAVRVHRLSSGRRARARALVAVGLRGDRGDHLALPAEPVRP